MKPKINLRMKLGQLGQLAESRELKGISAQIVALLVILAFILSIYLFLWLFKFHISVFAIDQINFNRYQDIPLNFNSLATDDPDVEWEIPLVFTMNKIHNSPLFDPETGSKTASYTKDAIDSTIDALRINLPDKCYYFAVDGVLENKIENENCDLSTKKFNINYPYPTFDGMTGKPLLVNLNLIIYSPSTSSVLTSIWPDFSSTAPAIFVR